SGRRARDPQPAARLSPHAPEDRRPLGSGARPRALARRRRPLLGRLLVLVEEVPGSVGQRSAATLSVPRPAPRGVRARERVTVTVTGDTAPSPPISACDRSWCARTADRNDVHGRECPRRRVGAARNAPRSRTCCIRGDTADTACRGRTCRGRRTPPEPDNRRRPGVELAAR